MLFRYLIIVSAFLGIQSVISQNYSFIPDYYRMLSSEEMSKVQIVIKPGIELFNSAEITFNQNTLTPNNSNGIHLRDINNDIIITDNMIEVNSASFECIKIDIPIYFFCR